MVMARALQHLSTPPGQRPGHLSLDGLDSARTALEAMGIAIPSWQEILNGAGPPGPDQSVVQDGGIDPGDWQHGWQFYTTAAQLTQRREELLNAASREDKARLRSCRGRNNSRWLTAVPYEDALVLSNPVLQCLLRRRLGLPVLVEAEVCEARTCQRVLDPLGHHPAACMRTGRIHARHAATIGPWKRVLSEAGYRPRIERLIRDTHIVTDPRDQRRMDIVASPGARSLGARGGVALFGDVTVVAVHTQSGDARPAAVHEDGGALAQGIAEKRRRYADVMADRASSFLVLGCEIYGRWSADATQIVRELVNLKAGQAPPALRGCAAASWSNRW